MPENNQMEILMQEKMEGFQLEPAPSDWQTIYDRLHPRKKRRMIWWLLPLVAALAGGALWYSNVHTYSADKEINSLAVANPEKEEKTDKSPDLKTDNKVGGSLNLLRSQPGSTNENKPSTSVITESKPQSTAQITPSTTRTQLKENTTRSSHPPKHNKTVGKSTKETVVEQVAIVEQATVIAEPESPTVDKQEAKSDKGITTTEIDSNQAGAKTSLTKLAIVDSGNNSTTAKTQIPTKTKPRKWNLSAYVAAGPAFPTEPLSMFPQMMAADLSSSPGNYQIYTNTTEQNGWHFAGGIMAEKKMGKRWLFSAGLGINSSTWKTTVEKYQDSVLSGSFYSRIKLSTETYNYQILMAEFPLQFSNKISGKKAGSLWWTIGLNNQFKLNITREATFHNPLTGNFSDKKSLNSSTRFYQPQLRLGLLYDHTKSMHWQVQPLLQYSMLPVYKNGNNDDMQMTNFQLQFNLFFQGSKHAAKTKR
jgi:hypothetical protein